MKLRPELLRFRTHGADRSGWSITYGLSRFLIAYGSGFSSPIGRDMMQRLSFPHAAKPRRPKRKRNRSAV